MHSSTNNLSLENIAIAAPCQVGWENMRGTEKERFCEKCSLNVYNISAMTENEATELLRAKQNNLCLRLFRRADGTLIFENCPVGLRRVRNIIKMSFRIAAGICAAVISVASALAKDDQSEQAKPGTKLNWTLIENGPTERNPDIFNPARNKRPEPTAMLGVPAFVSILNPPKTQAVGSDWSAADSFSAAMKSAEQGDLKKSKDLFEQALTAAAKPGADPMFRELIAGEYAKTLRKAGEEKEAQAIELKYKSGMIVKATPEEAPASEIKSEAPKK